MGTLDQLSRGIFLGVGTGEALNEVAVLNIKWPGFKSGSVDSRSRSS